MLSLEASNPIIVGTEKWNTAEVQENDYKIAIMNLFKYFKNIWINALIKFMKTITNSIQMEAVQDMAIEFNKEIELLTKFKTERKLEIKNLACQTKISKLILNKRFQRMKERISGFKSKVENNN